MINIDTYETAPKTKGYFLAVGRLIPYKKFDLIVETFNDLGLPLKIAGTGIMEESLKKIAKPNIEFLGFIEEERLKTLYSECEALIFPQLEDFGITPLEAMASGRPVIAYEKGGALETVIDGKTGVFFKKQDDIHLKAAVEKFLKEKHKFNKENIREHAKNFDEEEFERKFTRYIQLKWDTWKESLASS
jgi:glycosyltransferase involved in cell wall biosynthesis